MPATDDADTEQAWRQRVAQAARLAAADLAREDDPSLYELRTDLEDFAARMTTEAPGEADDPRRDHA